MKKIIFLIIIALYAQTAVTQTILLEKDINESVYNRKKGPDKSHFLHLYINLESYFSKGDNGFQAQTFLSYKDYFGLRNSYRLAKRYGLGYDVEFGRDGFRLGQNSQKTFPDSETHKKEVLYTYNLGAAFFNRIIISPRENSFGTWIDLGVYGSYTCGSRLFLVDDAPAVYQGTIRKSTIKGLKYTEPFNYGLKARLGYKRYAFTFSYRLSNWLKKSVTMQQPPRLAFGLELGLY